MSDGISQRVVGDLIQGGVDFVQCADGSSDCYDGGAIYVDSLRVGTLE